jgi:hypothetical protein
VKIPKNWDGKKSILEMKEGGSNQWRQMEWIGWYFEYLCQKNLSEIMEIPGPKYGNVSFDGFLGIPWDFKAHSTNSSSKMIVNDTEATVNAINEYGCVGLIVASGDVEYDDENRSFYKWHQEIKGGKSKYEIERIKRKATSRRRKNSFDLKEILFIKLTEETLKKHGSFQKNFRNSDGSPRREKVMIDLDNVNEELINKIDF